MPKSHCQLVAPSELMSVNVITSLTHATKMSGWKSALNGSIETGAEAVSEQPTVSVIINEIRKLPKLLYVCMGGLAVMSVLPLPKSQK